MAIRYTEEDLYSNVVYGYGCSTEGWNCTFFQNYYGEFKKKLISFDPRFGLKHNFHPFFIEYDIGLGYGKDHIYSPEISAGNDSEMLSNPFDTFVDGWKILFLGRANFGFKIAPRKQKLN